MYKRLTVLLTLCFLARFSSGQVCDSLEEGRFWSYSCSVKDFNKSIDFQLYRGDSFKTVTSCNKKECQTVNSNYNSSLKVDSGITPGMGGYSSDIFYKSQLEMKDVRRYENHFRCFVDGYSSLEECKFDIYVKPRMPICDTPVLTSSGDLLSVTCKTDQVYPNALCIFSSNALPHNFRVPVTYSNSRSPVKTGDVSTECEGQIPVSALSVGRYQFQVTMYAEVKDGKNKSSIKSDLTDPLELSLPKILIADDCPVGTGVKDGYIEQGTKATCKCELSYKGYPPGHAQWYTSFGRPVGVMNRDGSATLRLAYDASHPRPHFECRANSSLKGTKQTATFVPIFVDAVANNDGSKMNKDDDDDKPTSPDYLYSLCGLLLIVGGVIYCCRRKKIIPYYNRTFNTQSGGGQGNTHQRPQSPTRAGCRDQDDDDTYDLPDIDHGYEELRK